MRGSSKIGGMVSILGDFMVNLITLFFHSILLKQIVMKVLVFELDSCIVTTHALLILCIFVKMSLNFIKALA